MKIMTVDLEPDLRSTRSKSIEIIVPKLLDYFNQQKIKATFFTVSSLLNKHEDIIKEISNKHEVASHSHTHSWLTKRNAVHEISHSKLVFENYGFKISGFRAPKFITTTNHFTLLKSAGYSYDSSFNTSSFTINHTNIVPSIQFPTMFSGLPYRKLLYPFSNLFPKSKMFYLHPWEFLKRKDLPMGNSITEKLLKVNCGKKGWDIFTSFVEKENCKWVGCKEYLKNYS